MFSVAGILGSRMVRISCFLFLVSGVVLSVESLLFGVWR